jgi:diketogulonate reductase-like aldo/keto reductase
MGLDCIDLWLVHWPPNGTARPGTWEGFIAARDDGLTRAIGVSNYSLSQIDELVAATGVVPAVNQIEWSPSRYDASLVAALDARGVTLEGYSPFLSTDLTAPVLTDIARRREVTVRQVVVRWHLEHQTIVIPKSTNRERIAENFAVFGFALAADEVASIDGLANARRAPKQT